MPSRNMTARSKRGCRRRLQPFSPFPRLSRPVRGPAADGSRRGGKKDDKMYIAPINDVRSGSHHDILRAWFVAPAMATQRQFVAVDGGPVAEHRTGIPGSAVRHATDAQTVPAGEGVVGRLEPGASQRIEKHLKQGVGCPRRMWPICRSGCRRAAQVPGHGYIGVGSKVHRRDWRDHVSQVAPV